MRPFYRSKTYKKFQVEIVKKRSNLNCNVTTDLKIILQKLIQKMNKQEDY